jgi:hypothetical protein
MGYSFFVLVPFDSIFICSDYVASNDRVIYSPWPIHVSKYFIKMSYSINNSNTDCEKEGKFVPVLK